MADWASQIRELTPEDLPALAATSGGSAWSGGDARWPGYLAQHGGGLRVVLLAFEGASPVAYASLLWRSQHQPFAASGIPEIHDLVVAESHRRRGIASAMFAELEDRARRGGRRVIGLGVGLYADYGAAQRLYGRLGYAPDGVGVTYRNHPVAPGETVRLDDDLILWLTKTLV
jgi:GNAT superfamily N-acetyltransferase